MKIVKLKGGLGNQMFQYAFACLIHSTTGEDVKLDLTDYAALEKDYLRKPRILEYNCTLQVANEAEAKQPLMLKKFSKPFTLIWKCKTAVEAIANRKYYYEKNREFVDVSSIARYSYYNGYWQNYKYVEAVRDRLDKEFTPRMELSENTKRAIQEVHNCQSVFVGVRRGDYLAESKHYGVFDSSYYENAIKMILKYVDNPVFYVFSNDIEWAKANVDFSGASFVFRTPDLQTSDFEELQIMRNCKHAIIVNSTFHWWGAYLISNKDKVVVCPKKWFADNTKIDLIPDKWKQCE